MLDKLTADDFKNALGDSFDVVQAGQSATSFVLAAVNTTGVAGYSSSGREAFSLLFRGPMHPVFAQQIFPLRHERLGELEIFLVPLGPDGGSMQYEAIFT